MSVDKRNERNEKQRESRMANKLLADLNGQNSLNNGEHSIDEHSSGVIPARSHLTMTHHGAVTEADRNVRKRQRDKERYASMSVEKRNERNNKQRERRMANKRPADLNGQNSEEHVDVSVRTDEEGNSEFTRDQDGPWCGRDKCRYLSNTFRNGHFFAC